MTKKKFLIFSGSRAEFGLMQEFIIHMKKNFNTKLVISGSHLDKKFGYTINEIKKAKIKIHKTIKVHPNKLSFSEDVINKIIANGLSKFSSFFKKEHFSAIIVCGDRFENLSPCIAATFYKIPIIHFHGGEITEGAYDDTVRHMITKMSSLHFVSHDIYKKRVIQLGEYKKNIFNIGAIGYNKKNFNSLINKNTLKKLLNIEFQNNNFLIVLHPETQSYQSENILKNIFKVLKKFKKTNFFFTGNGADLNSEKLKSLIKKNVKNNKHSYYYFESLGRKLYLSLLKNMDCLIGNSSSGIYEAPLLKLPAVNIGYRQKGRVQANNIVNIKDYTAKNIERGIKKALKINKKKIKSVFIKPYPEKKSIEIIKKQNFANLLPKKFYDL